MSKKSRIQISDVRGLVHLIKDATIEVTDLTEAVHQRIVHPPLLPSTPIQHLITSISGIVYSTVRTITKLTGAGLEKILAQFNPAIDLGISVQEKETVVAALNGIIGDYMVKNNNPLAIPMQFRVQGEVIKLNSVKINKAYQQINGKIILMVHGLCQNEQRWNSNGHNHGESIARELDKTLIYLRYNGGLHISKNGQSLNRNLEDLIKAWPVPITELTIIGHSMGGLVSRSALHYGQQEKQPWTKYLKKLVFLGSPHHGAPLEQVGNHIGRMLEVLPYVKPFARLAKIRSAGITDLRYGNIVESDWSGFNRFGNHPDKKIHIPLPADVQCYAIAGSLAMQEDNFKARMLGDGLVQLKSALGKHKNPDKVLEFGESNTHITYETSHMDLLNSKKVYNKIKSWLVN